MEQDYTKLSADHLARAEYFRQWILHPDPRSIDFWEQYLKEHPKETEKILLAKELVMLISGVSTARLNPHRKNLLHQQLLTRIGKFEKRRRIRRILLSSAATIILLVAITSYFDISGLPDQDQVVFDAKFGERRTVTLPDGSMVDLNANSILRLGDHWEDGNREVWLEGEAFFTVEKKIDSGATFTVHTVGPDIEVLGTQFNVNSRMDDTKVFLEEGRIRLLITENNEQIKEHYLSPGDLAHFRKNVLQVSKQSIRQAESLVSWKTGYLVYENSSLSDVIKDIRFTYGKDVQVIDSELLEKRINGAVPTNNLDEFIRVTELLFGVHAEKNMNSIILKK